MKKIIVLIIGLFVFTLGVVGFAQNNQLSSSDSTNTKARSYVAQQKLLNIKGISNNNQVFSDKNLPNQQISTNSTDSSQLPVYVVMDELVFHANFVQNKIDEDSAKGSDVKALREFYKHRAKLTDEEDVIFKKEMKEADKNLKVTDNKIKAITQAYRAKVSEGIIPGQHLPDIPLELISLKNEREQFLTELPKVLEAKMGTNGYQKLKAFVDHEIAPRIHPIMAADVRNTATQAPSSPLQP